MVARALVATLFAFVFCGTPALAAGSDSDLGAVVLCYHIVESPQDPRMEISRETFRQHMRYLAMTGYNVIPLHDLYDYVTGKRAALPKNAIVVTLDDGWRSTYTEVFPEMKRYGFPFTVFIYPKIIGQTAYALTWKQVKEMSDAGVDVQSHSLSHPYLTKRRHTTLDQRQYGEWLQHELVDSKRLLEHETGKPVTFLAYPYGDYDRNLVANVSKAGYTAALTCEFGRVKRGSDLLRMRRVVVDKKMDFASFRHYLGAGSLRLDEMTPQPGAILDPGQSTIISAKIPKYQSLDPKSVGMALLTAPGSSPFAYDPQCGSISVILKEAVALKSHVQRALVWATDAKSGKRVEASWVFRLPDQPLPVQPSIIFDAQHMAPADAAPLAPLQSASPAAPNAPVTSPAPSGGGSARAGLPIRDTHDAKPQRVPKR